MALHIKNEEVERLAAEVAAIGGESKTEAVRKSLLERRDRLREHGDRRRTLEEALEWLEREVWSKIPPELLGTTLTREEEDEILGYGPDG